MVIFAKYEMEIAIFLQFTEDVCWTDEASILES